VFADEPTGNLDSRSADATIRIFEGLVADGMTLVMVTHEPAFAARANREVHLADGRVHDDESTRPNVIYMPR
jgi:putative ABC transport system ATP-binding protein